MLEEVALARVVHANCIRLWIEFSAWMADPDRITAHFMDAVACIAKAGMKTMPCLFNRWHDRDWDYGGTYTEHLFRNWQPMLDYVRALVAPLATDDHVLMWDLCNEPQATALDSEVNRREFDWLASIAQTVRECGPQQPLTIGTMSGGNIDVFAPLCDALCGHPYARDPEGLDGLIASFKDKAARYGKPLLVNECIPGALDDGVRAEVARWYTQRLSAAGFGWMGWALREGKAISTRRDRFDANGINGEGYHPFLHEGGKVTPGIRIPDGRADLPGAMGEGAESTRCGEAIARHCPDSGDGQPLRPEGHPAHVRRWLDQCWGFYGNYRPRVVGACNHHPAGAVTFSAGRDRWDVTQANSFDRSSPEPRPRSAYRGTRG